MEKKLVADTAFLLVMVRIKPLSSCFGKTNSHLTQPDCNKFPAINLPRRAENVFYLLGNDRYCNRKCSTERLRVAGVEHSVPQKKTSCAADAMLELVPL